MISVTRYPEPLIKLIEALKQFPGVGTRTAERFAFQMLTWPSKRLFELGRLIEALPSSIKRCPDCGCLADDGGCSFCTIERGQTGFLCVVASPRDVFSIESTGEFKGIYYVLDALLSPMDGIGPNQMKLEQLKLRVKKYNISEVIVAFDSTLEGDATALFIKEELENLETHVSRLAFGIPVGSSLDYVDGGTLTRAFLGRSSV